MKSGGTENIMSKRHLAIDLGASNGRAIVGKYTGSKFDLEEIHRFPNDPVSVGNAFFWDTLRLLCEIKTGITKSINAGGVETVGIDTWGVDYGYVGKDGQLLSSQYHYRDSRTDGMEAEVFGKVPYDELYGISGIQSQSINTLYQLAADVKYRPYIQEYAESALWTPDLLGYFLTGEKISEYTIASTGAFLNASGRKIDRKLLSRLGIRESLFPDVVMPGKVIAPLRSSVDDSFGKSGADLVSVASHDTASAVLAVPTKERDALFISSGTWSIMGVLTSQPVLTDEARKFGLSNEGGAFGEITLIKNIMGLWIEQECRRQWKREGKSFTYDELSEMAKKSAPVQSLINPADPLFTPAGNMPKRIAEYCARTSQHVPENEGETVRCIFDSLALCYRKIADDIEKITGKRYNSINIIGGGTKERLLSSLAADASGRYVTAGPDEATALGNIAMQAYASGELADYDEIKDAVLASVHIEEFEPDLSCKQMWDDAYERFLKLD